jgi:pyruvate dehydrogenase E2 component (dihydrolipoamide acetyltransferase)
MKELGLPSEIAREIDGSGPGGRILDRDVAAWVAAREAAPQAAPGEPTVTRTIPLRGRRRTIATRMVDSLRTAAQLTSVLELDVKPLVELRSDLNVGSTERRIGVTAIVVKLVAAALREHPGLNARVAEDGIELLGEINVAVAVETEDGLVAPVVAGADRLSIEQIDERIAALAARARERALEPDDLAGGTFTVSNGGIHPVDITTAILNPPQVGILWIGRIKDRPVALEGGAIAVRPTMQACLTFDHRAIDGGPAAAFLATIESLVAALPELPR